MDILTSRPLYLLPSLIGGYLPRGAPPQGCSFPGMFLLRDPPSKRCSSPGVLLLKDAPPQGSPPQGCSSLGVFSPQEIHLYFLYILIQMSPFILFVCVYVYVYVCM